MRGLLSQTDTRLYRFAVEKKIILASGLYRIARRIGSWETQTISPLMGPLIHGWVWKSEHLMNLSSTAHGKQCRQGSIDRAVLMLSPILLQNVLICVNSDDFFHI